MSDEMVMDLGSEVMDAGVEDVSVDTTEAVDTTDEGAEPSAVDRDSKAYRDAVKAWRDSVKDNPEIFKHAKRAYDLNGRMEQLAKLDPKGIDGVRERYALIEAAGGPEAITTMQQRVQEIDAQNEMWQKGDPRALENIPAEWDKGLAKLAPQYLDRIQKADPQAYAQALLPHLMTNLNASAAPQAINAMVDVLTSAQGTPEEKLEKIKQSLIGLTGWWKTQEERASQFKSKPQANPQESEFEQQRTEFEKQKSDHFWNTQVWPDVTRYQTSKIEAAVKTYQDRLKLPEQSYRKLIADINGALNDAGAKDKGFSDKMDLYRKAKSPVAAQIQTHVKSYVDKYAKQVADRVVEERYGRFLASRPGPKPGSTQPPKPGATTQANAPLRVAAKPSRDQIDYDRTTRDMMWKNTYILKNGKTVVVAQPKP